MSQHCSADVLSAAAELRDGVAALQFGSPVTHVYNPLDYAWEPHRLYVERFASTRKRVLFLGMNPGPFGMAQTGVPFGEIAAVRDWMGITAEVGQPASINPKRPIEGFDCNKSEVSGRRLWGLFAERFETPERFFRDHFVVNYCPLVFMEESGRNRTPDKLSSVELAAVARICDHHLSKVIAALDPEWLIGVGAFAMNCFLRVAGNRRVGTILHPSPASPAANRGWAAAATKQLLDLGVWHQPL